MLSELFKILGTIAVDPSGAMKALDDTSDKASSTSTTLSKIGTVAKGVGAAALAGAGMATAAVGAIGKSAIGAYADYEQLVGGVETLFGDSASAVIKNSEDAYKNAGLSANDYMETVTGFSASLLQSLGGDTEKAAEQANIAIQDMSDNANKMGTDIGSIQNAYQGFAKQNYTMLDNLKLGYGGTKEEMERLLSDAGELATKYGLVDESAKTLVVDEEELAKAQKQKEKAQKAVESSTDALYKKQMSLEKAQISYNEAVAKSGENSSQAQKALLNLQQAQHNLNTEQEKHIEKQAELTQATEHYEEVAKGVMENGPIFDINSYSDIIQAIHLVQDEMKITGTTQKEASTTIQGSVASMKGAWQNFLAGMTDSSQDIDKLIQNLFDSIVTVAENILPRISGVVSGVASLVFQLAPKILAEIPKFIADVVPALLTSITDSIPMFIDSLVGIITFLADNFETVILPILTAIPDIIIAVINALIQNLPALTDGLIKLIIGIVDAIPQIINPLLLAIPDITIALIDALWLALPSLIVGIGNVLISLGKSIFAMIQGYIEAVIKSFQLSIGKIKDVFKVLPGWLKDNVAGPFKLIFSDIWNVLKKGASSAWDGIKKVFGNVSNWFRDTFSKAWQKVKDVFSTGGKIFSGIKEGIEATFKNVVNTIIRGINTVIAQPFNKINDVLSVFRNTNIAGFQPFKGIASIGVPAIPELAEGGILKKGQIGLLEGDGTEAVIPLEKNTGWIDMVAERLNGAGSNDVIRKLDELIQAITGMNIVLDSGEMVGALTPAIDTSLGTYYTARGRGR